MRYKNSKKNKNTNVLELLYKINQHEFTIDQGKAITMLTFNQALGIVDLARMTTVILDAMVLTRAVSKIPIDATMDAMLWKTAHGLRDAAANLAKNVHSKTPGADDSANRLIADRLIKDIVIFVNSVPMSPSSIVEHINKQAKRLNTALEIGGWLGVTLSSVVNVLGDAFWTTRFDDW